MTFKAAWSTSQSGGSRRREQDRSGTAVLNGVNTYTGIDHNLRRRLQANDSSGYDGKATISIPNNSLIVLDGGVLQSNPYCNFTRPLGTSGNAFQWTANGGGFSACRRLDVGQHRRRFAHADVGHNLGSQIVGTLKLSSATSAISRCSRTPSI